MNLPKLVVAFALGLTPLAACGADASHFQFDFGSGPARSGRVKVAPTAVYSPEAGYGFENAPALTATAGGVASEQPFVFSVKAPEGNYRVVATLGDGKAASIVTIKAENRRLMIDQAPVAAGKLETRTFTVNIRSPLINSGSAVALNSRESGPPMTRHWDEKLTLEFNGAHPALSALDIVLDDSALTVFLAGDSTVTDQPNEPWAGWGQILPRFFQPGVAVANHAESGRALNSFKAERRFAKIYNAAKPGDYLFVQFGHNDSRDKGEGAGPFTTYKDRLIECVQEARSLGMIPVLVTPMERRRFVNGQPAPTLAEYAEAVRQVGQEQKAPVIDLNAMSMKFYAALGPEQSTKAFVHYPAGTYPGQDKPLKDDTHHNAYGAYELARCVVEGIKTEVPELAKRLMPDAGTFDSSKPDPVDQFKLPASPSAAAKVEKPAGN